MWVRSCEYKYEYVCDNEHELEIHFGARKEAFVNASK